MISCVPDSVERVLKIIQVKIDNYLSRDQQSNQQQQQQPRLDNQSRYTPMKQNNPSTYDQQLLTEKDQTIQELRETIGILELKINKLETLVSLKDTKIKSLEQKLR